MTKLPSYLCLWGLRTWQLPSLGWNRVIFSTKLRPSSCLSQFSSQEDNLRSSRAEGDRKQSVMQKDGQHETLSFRDQGHKQERQGLQRSGSVPFRRGSTAPLVFSGPSVTVLLGSSCVPPVLLEPSLCPKSPACLFFGGLEPDCDCRPLGPGEAMKHLSRRILCPRVEL